MKKKVISLMLIGAMVASMAACGSNGGDKGGAKGNDTSAADEADGGASEGGDTLTVWTWDPKFNIPAIEEAGNIYKADHQDFNLKVVETLSDDCESKLIAAAEGGDLSTLPDIVLMQDNSYQKFVTAYPEAFEDLTDSGIDFSQFPA